MTAANGGATIRETFDLLEKVRHEVLEELSTQRGVQLDFNMHMATRVEALSTRLSGHESMSSHSTFTAAMNETMTEMKLELSRIRTDVEDLKLRYAKAAAVVGVILIIVTLATNVVSRLI